jgi:hypothetical protein
MTSLHFLDDDDDMTIRRKKEEYVYLRWSPSRCVRKSVLVRWMYRHTVIDVRKSCSFSNISNDGTSMTGARRPLRIVIADAAVEFLMAAPNILASRGACSRSARLGHWLGHRRSVTR